MRNNAILGTEEDSALSPEWDSGTATIDSTGGAFGKTTQ